MLIQRLFDDTPYIITHKSERIRIKDEFYPTNAKINFLCKSVTLTQKYQQPIIRPYEGTIPVHLCAIRKVKPNERKHNCGHFYNTDNQIERFWNRLPQYISLFDQFHSVIGIDLSCTEEMPTDAKRWNCFRNKLFVAYLQYHNVSVIPNISWWSDVDWNWCLDGLPKHSVIAINSTGLRTNPHSKKIWIEGYKRVIDMLEPITIIRYGAKQKGECESISFYYPNDNERR